MKFALGVEHLEVEASDGDVMERRIAQLNLPANVAEHLCVCVFFFFSFFFWERGSVLLKCGVPKQFRRLFADFLQGTWFRVGHCPWQLDMVARLFQ